MRKGILLLLIFFGFGLSAQNQFVKLDSIILRQMSNSDLDWGDYDNDGDLDLLLSGQAANGGTVSTESYIYRNDGNKTFTNLFASIPYLYGGTANWSDIDNDGDLDFLLTGAIGSSGQNYTKLCINNGNDNFEFISTELPVSEFGIFCNLNNDGLEDIIFCNWDLQIVINSGDYTFTEVLIDYPEGARNLKISVGDFNNDNFDDFVIVGTEYINYENFTRNYIYKNNQDGTFSKIAFEPQENVIATSIWTDLDSDGDVDLIYAGNSWDTGESVTFIYENLGDDNFTEVSHNLPAFTRPTYGVADYDNNGYIDLIISGYFTDDEDEVTHLFKNQGNWDFIEDNNSSFEINNIFDIEFADIDRDNDLDLGVTVNKYWDRLTYMCENHDNGNQNNPPGAPQQLLSGINSGQLNLSWEVAADQETPTQALTYNLYIKRDGLFVINPNAILSSGDNKLVTAGNQGVNNNVNFDMSTWEEGHYFWSVQTIDQGYLASNFHEPKEFTIYYDNLTDAPSGLEVVNADLSKVKLSWVDNSTDDANFIIERSESVSDNFIEIAVLNPDVTEYDDLTIQSLTEYYYRVKMITYSSDTGYSGIKYIKALPGISESPSNLVAAPVSASEISLTWIDNSNSETGFVLEFSASNSNNFSTIDTLPANTNSYNNTGLNLGTNYFYRIYAINEDEQSDYSNTAIATTKVIHFNITDGVLGEINNGEGMAWGDFDNDNFEDLFISSYPTALYKNNGDATFSKVVNSGICIDSTEYNHFGVWGDYDNDGYLDLFVASENTPNHIFHNNGDATFTELLTGEIVTEMKETKSASWNDYDNDGDLDIFISNNGQNYLYTYNGKNVFSKIPFEGGKYSRGSSWGDYNNDGFIDLYVANNTKNVFYKNNGTDKFEKITEGQIVNNEDYHFSFSAAWGDYNNDGFIDMLITNNNNTKEWLYQNNGDETFSKVENIFQYDVYRDNVYTGYWVDYDNDTDLDIFFVINDYTKDSHKLYTNIGNNTFVYSEVNYGDEPSNYYANFGSCYDYNNDGFNDILMNKSVNEILTNEGNGNNWIKIVLKGTPSNSFGVGAKVKIKTGDIWQYRTVRTLGAYHSQNGNILNFGLKDAEIIDSIIVNWPMETVQILTNVDVNQKIEILESDADFKPLYKPSNLNAESSWGSILVSWEDNTQDEQNFILERSVGDTSNFQQCAVLDANITEYSDSNVVNSILLYYRLKAVKGDSSSYWSNLASARLNYFKQRHDSVFAYATDHSECVAWIDYNNDNFLDLYVGNKYSNDKLYKNTGNDSFSLVDGTPITTESTITNFGAWADYDNNGFVDLFVANGGYGSGSPSEMNDNLFKSTDNGEFTKITEGELVNDNSESCVGAWADYDADGFLDIFVGNENGYSSLYRNIENDDFLKADDLPISGLKALDAVWSDFDKDNDLDLMTMGNQYDPRLRIFENMGDGVFENVSLSQIGLSYNTQGNSINVEDFNNDGLFDIFIARNGNNRLFISNMGYYEEQTNNVLVEDSDNSGNSICGDINNDGFIDIFVSNYESNNYLYLNNGNLTFTKLNYEPMSEKSTATHSAAFGDFNTDGKIDLFTVNENETNNLFINQARANSWLAFRLKSETNKNIIGTKIELHINDEVQIREVRTNSGKGAQNAFDVYFGLGENKADNYVRIISPTGATTKITDFSANQINEIDFDVLALNDKHTSLFNLYPNPANNSINIDLSKNENIRFLRILNASGIVVKELNVNNVRNITVALDELPAGYYFVFLFTDNIVLYEKLIIWK